MLRPRTGFAGPRAVELKSAFQEPARSARGRGGHKLSCHTVFAENRDKMLAAGFDELALVFADVAQVDGWDSEGGASCARVRDLTEITRNEHQARHVIWPDMLSCRIELLGGADFPVHVAADFVEPPLRMGLLYGLLLKRAQDT